MSTEREKDDVLVLDEEKEDQKLEPPKQYAVMLLNDDFTPMDFVVEILKTFFGKGDPEATRIMFDVHKKGKGRAGVYSKDIAATKASQVIEISQAAEFPLRAVTEPME